MIPHKLAVEQVRKRRKVVIATFWLLVIAFIESLYISCVKDFSPIFCPLSWIYAVLAGIVLLVLWHYRK